MTTRPLRVGVLALQGAFQKHIDAIIELGADACAVRTVDELETVTHLIIPGGESTTISMLLDRSGLREPIGERLAAGMATFGTCAGMIMLADKVLDGRDDQQSFGAIDVTVRRNGYGRQLASFETDLSGGMFGDDTFHAVFIRAPILEALDSDVEVLATHDDVPVLCRSGHVLIASFHPELSPDRRIHEYFLEIESAG